MPDDELRISAGASLRVLVTGATGRFGGIADLLLERGHAVRVATRDPSRPAALRLAARGAEITRADYDDADSLAAAARGADAVFGSGTAHQAGPAGEARHGRNLADALARAGAPYLVFVSGAGADRPTGVPVLEAKRAVEAEIGARRIPACIIAPGYLMENLFNPWNLGALGAGVLPTPIPPGRSLQQVATADVVALAEQAIERPEAFAGERIEVASDELTGDEAAAVLADRLGRPMTARQVPMTQLPPGLVAMFEWLERDPLAVSISGLRERFPAVGWHSFSDWASKQSRLMDLRGAV